MKAVWTRQVAPATTRDTLLLLLGVVLIAAGAVGYRRHLVREDCRNYLSALEAGNPGYRLRYATAARCLEFR